MGSGYGFQSNLCANRDLTARIRALATGDAVGRFVGRCNRNPTHPVLTH